MMPVGAQAFSSFDTLLAPFVKIDNLSYKEVKQAMQTFIYGVNISSRWGCVPETYRVMTPTGWKGIDELKSGDPMFTWKNGKLQICPNNATVIKDYNDDLICFENNQYGYLQEVTDYHRTLVCKTNRSLEDAEIMQAGDIYNDPFNGNYTLPSGFTGAEAYPGIDLSDDEIRLAAMIYTDGSFDWRENSIHKISYYKSVCRNDKIHAEDIFARLGFETLPALTTTPMSKHGVFKWSFYGEDARRIVQIVGQKDMIAEKFFMMNTHQAEIFLDTWMSHDGDYTKKTAQCDNPYITDALLFIHVLAGKTAYYRGRKLFSGHVCNYVKSVQVDKVHFNAYKRRYNGRVWCPSNDDGTAIFMNDRGGVFISGQCQAPFTNITLDWTVPEDLADQPAIVAGQPQDFTYKDCVKEQAMVNKAFIDVMLHGDAEGRCFQYPIPTYSITKEFDWSDTENNRMLFEMTAKYGTPYFSNYVNSDMKPSDIRSMCCRLRLDLKEVRKKLGGGYFGAGSKTGSVGVVTINMPRIAYLSENKEDFFKRLDHIMDIAARSLHLKRKAITQFLEQGLYPYTKHYIQSFETFFSTIGVIGFNEVGLNAKWLGHGMEATETQEFTKEVLEYMKQRLLIYQETYKAMFNLEATPAESTCYRLAKHDKEHYPDIKSASSETPYYTNSSHLPVGYTGDLCKALTIQDPLQVLYTSGTVFHAFLGEALPDWQSAANIVQKITENFKLPYFTISPTFSVCRSHGYLSGNQPACPQCGNKTEVYSRISGYYRSTDNWNAGKMEEFGQRKTYTPDVTALPSATEVTSSEKEEPWRESIVKTIPDILEKVKDTIEAKAEAGATFFLLTTPTCPNCKILKRQMEAKSLVFQEVDMTDDTNNDLIFKLRCSNVKSVPSLVKVVGDQMLLAEGCAASQAIIRDIHS